MIEQPPPPSAAVPPPPPAVALLFPRFAIGALVQTFLVPSQARMLFREEPELVTFGAPPAPPLAKRSAEPTAEKADEG